MFKLCCFSTCSSLKGIYSFVYASCCRAVLPCSNLCVQSTDVEQHTSFLKGQRSLTRRDACQRVVPGGQRRRNKITLCICLCVINQSYESLFHFYTVLQLLIFYSLCTLSWNKTVTMTSKCRFGSQKCSAEDQCEGRWALRALSKAVCIQGRQSMDDIFRRPIPELVAHNNIDECQVIKLRSKIVYAKDAHVVPVEVHAQVPV